MTKVLNKEDVTVSTATVGLKVIRIGNRQLTLSVFRQLPYRTLVTESPVDHFLVSGAVWGRVNYCARECKDASDHLHVVNEYEGKLYVSYVEKGGHKYAANWNGLQSELADLESVWREATGYHSKFSEVVREDKMKEVERFKDARGIPWPTDLANKKVAEWSACHIGLVRKWVKSIEQNYAKFYEELQTSEQLFIAA